MNETGVGGIVSHINDGAGAALRTPSRLAERRWRSTGVDTVRVPLHSRKTPGLFALVDGRDADRVLAHKWHPKPGRHTFYAHRNIRIDGRRTTQSLHVFVSEGIGIDHVNGDGLECTRANLRPATPSQNQHNRGPDRGSRRPKTSRFKGVSFNRCRRKWYAQICANNRRRHLGSFDDQEAAARAYDIAARRFHGEFARCNFPEKKG